MADSKRPTALKKMIEGAAIQPSGTLLDWLNRNARSATGARRLFRLPVVIRFQDEYRLELGDAFVGAAEETMSADPIALSLDTSAMGMSLWSLLNERCPKALIACAVWLDGYWGSSIETGESDASWQGGVRKWPFTVLRLHGLIEERTRRATVVRALVEAEC